MFQRVVDFVRQLVERIADDALAHEGNAEQFEQRGDLERIRVDARRPKHLRTDGDDGRVHRLSLAQSVRGRESAFLVPPKKESEGHETDVCRAHRPRNLMKNPSFIAPAAKKTPQRTNRIAV